MEKEYIVTWTVQVNAESFQDAALQALGMHRDPEGTATVFEIQDTEGQVKILDVQEDNSVIELTNLNSN